MGFLYLRTNALPPQAPPERIGGKGPLRPRSSPRREYVAAGGSIGIDFRTLPQHIDSITADFGNDLYDRMLLDPQCAAAVNLLKLAIISQGVTLLNPLKQSDPEYAQAQTILEFCQRNMERLDRPQRAVLYELLDGLAFGHKVAEQIYEVPEDGPDQGMLCLRSIKVKPRKSVAFVVDAFNNIVAIAAVRADRPGSSVIGRNYFTGSGDTANLLPREKFVVFTYRSKDSDPRGSSVLRAAYGAWWLKMQLFPEYTKYLSQFASPQVIAILPEDVDVGVLQDELGNRIDEDGNILTDDQEGVEIDPAKKVLETLLTFRNSAAAVFDHDTEVKPFQANGEGQPFLLGFSYLDDQIVMSILSEKLATQDSKFMARAASEVHQDVLQLVIGEGKYAVADTWRQDVILRLVEYNYGPNARHLAPLVGLPEVEHQDFPAVANAIAALMKADYFAPSQLPHLDAKMNLYVRDETPEQEQERLNPPVPEPEKENDDGPQPKAN